MDNYLTRPITVLLVHHAHTNPHDITRCQSSLRHYRVVWDGKQFKFGLGKFPTVEALLAHFYNKPIISGDSGMYSLSQQYALIGHCLHFMCKYLHVHIYV